MQVSARACLAEAQARRAAWRSHLRRPRVRPVDLAAGFLGAVTALGMTVVLFLGSMAAAFLIARIRHADPAVVVAGILSHPTGVDLLGALVISLMVLGAFFCGGYVATRMSRRDSRRQAVAMWLWALAAPTGLALIALAFGGAPEVDKAVRLVAPMASLTACLAVMGLLGALLGGETGQRVRRGTSVRPIPLMRVADGDDLRILSGNEPGCLPAAAASVSS